MTLNKTEDPYSIEESLWLEDMTKWPDLQFGDISPTMLIQKNATQKNLKAYKFLEAYNYFYNGHLVSLESTKQRLILVKRLLIVTMNLG